VPLDFNGTTQAAFMGLSIATLNAQAFWTLMCWLQADTVAVDQDLLSLAIGPPPGTSATSRAGIAIDAGGVGNTFNRAGDGEAAQTVNTAAGFIVAGVWTHYAMTVDIPADTVRIYKDGVLNTTGVVAFVGAAASATDSKNGAFGADDVGTALFYNGRMDDVRVIPRLLSANEIQTIYTLRGIDRSQGAGQRYMCCEGVISSAAGLGTIKDSGAQQRNCDGLNGPTYAEGILRYRRKAA
jgi:hypothetical protein